MNITRNIQLLLLILFSQAIVAQSEACLSSVEKLVDGTWVVQDVNKHIELTLLSKTWSEDFQGDAVTSMVQYRVSASSTMMFNEFIDVISDGTETYIVNHMSKSVQLGESLLGDQKGFVNDIFGDSLIFKSISIPDCSCIELSDIPCTVSLFSDQDLLDHSGIERIDIEVLPQKSRFSKIIFYYSDEHPTKKSQIQILDWRLVASPLESAQSVFLERKKNIYLDYEIIN